MTDAVRADPLEVVNSWRQILVKGQKEQIDRFLDHVGKRFEGLGWSREADFEALLTRQPHQLNHPYCWVSGRGRLPRVLLCLTRMTDRRIRGGPYDLLDGRPSLVELAREVQRVLTEVLEPAAAVVGLTVSYPRLGPISRVGANTTAFLTATAEVSDGRWPLPEVAETLWNKCIIAAVREDVAIHPEELVEWFVASGWDREHAIELANRFYQDAARVEESEEAGRQTA